MTSNVCPDINPQQSPVPCDLSDPLPCFSSLESAVEIGHTCIWLTSVSDIQLMHVPLHLSPVQLLCCRVQHLRVPHRCLLSPSKLGIAVKMHLPRSRWCSAIRYQISIFGCWNRVELCGGDSGKLDDTERVLVSDASTLECQAFRSEGNKVADFAARKCSVLKVTECMSVSDSIGVS